MAVLPNSLALTGIPDGSAIIAADHRNNYTAIQTALNALIAALSGGASGQMLNLNGTTVTPIYPPGYLFDYAQFTADVAQTATTAATANTVVTGGAVTYDGATAVIVKFFAPYGINVAGQLLNLELYQDGAALATLGALGAAAAIDVPINLELRFTPTAGAHTYSVRAWGGASGGTVKAGTGSGAGVLVAGHIRITKG